MCERGICHTSPRGCRCVWGAGEGQLYPGVCKRGRVCAPVSAAAAGPGDSLVCKDAPHRTPTAWHRGAARGGGGVLLRLQDHPVEGAGSGKIPGLLVPVKKVGGHLWVAPCSSPPACFLLSGPLSWGALCLRAD